MDEIRSDSIGTLKFTERDLRLLHFQAKLAAEFELMAVVRKVDQGVGDFVLLDIRDADAFAQGHIPGALSLPLADIPARVASLPKDRQYVAYCWRDTCHLAARAAIDLMQHGFDVQELNAGWREWTSFGYPVESGVKPQA
jgi:rhodanese-related sulfurtransferase